MPASLSMSSLRWHVGSMGSMGRKSVEVYGCDAYESARLNMKTRHCISGCNGVVLSGLGWTAAPYTITDRHPPPPHAVMADKDPPSLTLPED